MLVEPEQRQFSEPETIEKQLNGVVAFYIKLVAIGIKSEEWWDHKYWKTTYKGYPGTGGDPAKFQKKLDLSGHNFIESAGLVVVPDYQFPDHVGTAYGVRLSFRLGTPENKLIQEDAKGGVEGWVLARHHWSYLFSERGRYDPDNYYTIDHHSIDELNRRAEKADEGEEFLSRIPRRKNRFHLKWAGLNDIWQMQPDQEIRLKIIAIDALSELSREYPQRFPDFGRFIRDSIQAEATSSR